MMEGFEKQSKLTGTENSFNVMKRQNDEVEAEMAKIGGVEGFNKLIDLKKQTLANKQKEEELEKMRRDLAAKKDFYSQNAPPEVRAQLGEVFKGVLSDEATPAAEGPPRITEIDID